MKRALLVILSVAGLAGSVLAIGCGGDDVSGSATDSGPDGAPTGMDSSRPVDSGRSDAAQPDSSVTADGGGTESGVVGSEAGPGDATLTDSGDGGGAPGDGGSDSGDGGDGAVGPMEFTVFTKQLIETQTLENNTPTTTEDKVFIDTPPPGVFPPAFFP